MKLLALGVYMISALTTLLFLTSQPSGTEPTPVPPHLASSAAIEHIAQNQAGRTALGLSRPRCVYSYPPGWKHCQPKEIRHGQSGRTGGGYAALVRDCYSPRRTCRDDCHEQVIPPPAWQIAAQQWGCGDDAMVLLTDAGERYGVDPALLVCLARYESSFNPKCRGAAGERGLLQVHPRHRRSMARAGLSFDSEADRLHYACLLITDAQRAGKSLYEAIRPWSVRRRAWKLYLEVTE